MRTRGVPLFLYILLNKSLARINKNYFLFEPLVYSYKKSAEMMVWYVTKLRKLLVCFNWISSASFVALNKRGVKTCFNSINGNTELMQHRFIKSFVFQFGRIGHSEKKIKVVSIEHK